MLVWYDGINKYWLSILYPQPSDLNFEFSILHSPSFYLKSPVCNLNSPSTLLPPFFVISIGYCQKLNLTSPQRLGFTRKWLCNHPHHHLPPPTHTQCQQYLSCYWPDFDETLKGGSWEHIEQITTVTVTFVQATFVKVTFVHIRNISTVTDMIWT